MMSLNLYSMSQCLEISILCSIDGDVVIVLVDFRNDVKSRIIVGSSRKSARRRVVVLLLILVVTLVDVGLGMSCARFETFKTISNTQRCSDCVCFVYN